MPADAQIRITAENQTPQAFRQVDQSLKSLDQETRAVQSSTRQSAAALGLFDDEAKQAAIGVTSLGRSVFNTSNEARKFGGVFRGVDGRLRETNGRFVKGRETVDQLGRSFQRTGRNAGLLGRGLTRASGGANILTRSVGSLGGVLGALGIAAVTHEIGRFGITSVQTAGRIDQIRRAMTNIEGSAEGAQVRFESLIQVANRPGLQLEALTRFSNRLSAMGVAGEDVDKILLGTGQTIVSLGGTAASAELAMEQLVQAFGSGTVDMRDFRTVIQQIPGFYQALGDVHGVTTNMEGMREAFHNVGDSMRDLVIPVFDELAKRFEAPPDDSYIVAMDTLENAFTLFQASVGDLFLPTVTQGAIALSAFFETIRAGIKDVTLLPEPIQAIVSGSRELYDALVAVSQSIRSVVGPPVEYLISNFGSLLGSVLELAGALYTALEPVLKAQATILGVVVTAVAQLAEHLTLLIGGLADAVNWVSSLWREEDRAKVSTQQLATAQGQLASATESARQATEGAAAATQSASSAYDAWQQRIKDTNAELDAHNERLERLQARYQQNIENGIDPNTRSMLSLARTIETLGGETETYQQRVKDTQGELETLTQRLEQQTALYDKYIEDGASPAAAAMENLARNIENLESQVTALTPSVKENQEATESVADAAENYSLTLSKLKATAEDSRETLSDTIDPQQIEDNYQRAVAASDASYAAQIANAEAALAKEKEGSKEYQKIETNLFNFRRDSEQARNKLATEAADHSEQEEKRQAESAERLTKARIESAERARAAEVAGFNAAARQGSAYAEQLGKLVSPSRRQAFIDIVNNFQEQGLSLDEARRKAEPYYELLLTISTPIQAADSAFGDFTSNLVRGANQSASAIGSLMGAVDALGTSIRENLPDTAGSLERSLLNEQRYFQENPTGITLDDIQTEAGQQGRQFVGDLFRRQDREAERAASEAQRESIQLYNDLSDATVHFTSNLIDLQGETNLADRAFQDLSGTFGRLATGDFTALLDIPIQLLNISRQAAAEREQGARDRAALYEEQFGEFERFGRNFDVVSGVLGIPESPELGDSFFFNPAGEFENVLAQSTADFSDGIKNALLSSVINLERDIRPEDITAIFQSSIDALGETLSQSQFNLDFDEQLGRDTAESYNALISDTTAFYQAQIDAINLVRQATGDLSFGDPAALARASQAETNRLRLAAPASGPQNAQQFLAQNNITQGLAAPTDDQERGLTSAEVAEADDILSGISDLDISNLQGIADDALGVFREAITAPARTIESINTAFEEILPDLRTLYDNISEQIIGTDGIISDAEQIQLNNLGSFEDFTQQYANLRDQAIDGVNATQQRLAITSQQIATGEGLRQFGELANAPNTTIEGLTTAWTQNVLPLVNALYDDLFAQIAGPDGFINTADEQIDFLGLGSREDFVSDYENNILNPALDSLTTIEQNIAQLLQGRELENTFDNFNDASLAPGQTIAGLTTYWETNVVPVLRETYNGLRDQIIGKDGLISPAEMEQLIQMGLDPPFEDWVGEYEDGLLTPGLDRLQTAAGVIASITQDREQSAVIEMFNEAITAPGQTIDGLNTFWVQQVVPELRETYNFLRNEIIGEDGLISPEEAATLTQAGLDIPFEDWVSSFEDNILTPGIDRLSGVAAVIASVMQNREESNIIEMFNAAAVAPGATIEGVNQYWVDTVVPVLRQTYESLRNDIIGEDGLISPEEAAELVSRGLDIPFEDWVTPYENDILTPAIDSLSAAAQVIASVTQSGEQSAVIEMFNNSVKAPGATIAGLTAFWQAFVVPELRQTYDALRDGIIGEDGLISPQELAELTEQGLNVPFEDWAGQFENDILTPGIDFLKGEAEYLQSTQLTTGVDDVIEMWKEQLAAPGATIAGLTETWNSNVVPALRALYQDLYDDIAGPDGIINTAREKADLLRLGSVDDFVAGFTSDIFTPLTTGLQRGRSQGRSNLASNAVNEARFNLGQSGSEGEFETNRGILIGVVNDFYAAEEERIRGLGLSATDLVDQLQDLNLSRRSDIQGVIDLDNRFQTDRSRWKRGHRGSFKTAATMRLRRKRIGWRALRTFRRATMQRFWI